MGRWARANLMLVLLLSGCAGDFEGSELYEEVYSDIEKQIDLTVGIYGDMNLSTFKRALRNNPKRVKLLFEMYQEKYCEV